MVFVGLKAICEEMEWGSINTLRAKVINEGFPAYKARRGSHGRLWWHADKDLIRVWRARLCEKTRQELIKQEMGKLGVNG